MQLSFFQPEPTPKPKYPWLICFPEWHPIVGGIAQMHSVILEKYGYCYGDPVRINSIDGDNVRCTVEHQMDDTFWKNGTQYDCSLSDLWPIIS